MSSSRAREIPTLHTQRLRLRPHTAADFPACTALWANSFVTRFIGGRALTREEVWARLLRYAGSWQWLGFGYWAVDELSTGEFIGELGFAQNERDFDPRVSLVDATGLTMPEVGWVLAPQFYGRGYATEAVRAALAWGDSHIAVSGSFCIIHPNHSASIGVAQKCGFLESSRPFYQSEPTILFTRKKT
jgi:RimJ/RimL family protein N-acetyltransferase